MAALTWSAISTVLPPETLRTSMATARCAVDVGGVALLLLRVLDARHLREPHRHAVAHRDRDLVAKSRGSAMRPLTRTRSSRAPRSTRPAGTSAFSRCSAATTMSGDDARARSCGRAAAARGSRGARPPTTVTLPTPWMFSMRRLMVSSASRVRSRSGQPRPRTAKVMIGSPLTRRSARSPAGRCRCGRSLADAVHLGAHVGERVHDLGARARTR